MSILNELKIIRLKKMLHFLAYLTLFFDMGITAVTLLVFFHPAFDITLYLWPITICLSIATLVSIGVGIFWLYLRHLESFFERAVYFGEKIIPRQRSKYNFKPK